MQNTDTPDPLLSIADRRRSELNLTSLARLVTEWEREREASADPLLGPMIAEAKRRIAKLRREAGDEAAVRDLRDAKAKRSKGLLSAAGGVVVAPAA